MRLKSRSSALSSFAIVQPLGIWSAEYPNTLFVSSSIRSQDANRRDAKALPSDYFFKRTHFMADDLQFERAEFDAPPTLLCGGCGQPLAGSYFQAGGKVFCETCAERVRKYAEGGGDAANVIRALFFGLGAAAVGGAIYAAIMISTNSQWGIVSIGVGIIVGKAVRKGSGNRGGVTYQWMAAVLTYAAIAGAYAAGAYHELPDPTGDQIAALIFAAYRMPFMGGASNAIGLLIIAFGVWQAWQLNRGVRLEVTGPHPIPRNPSASA
jgi:hypothetical protein